MMTNEHDFQARMFLQYRARWPRWPWRKLFAEWAESKEFALSDELAIYGRVCVLLDRPSEAA